MAEFTTCLVTDDESTEVINDLRNGLAASPYRDDRPHVTVLHAIAPQQMTSDDELVADLMKQLEGIAADLIASTARRWRVASIPNNRYKVTSVILLRPDSHYRTVYRRLVKQLRQAGYKIGLKENIQYRLLPHTTIRLGVPIKGEQLAKAKQVIRDNPTTRFKGLMVLTIEKTDGQRVIRELPLV